jgi:chromosome segregation ATPase
MNLFITHHIAEFKNSMENMSISENDKTPSLDGEIDLLKEKIKEIEDKLRLLRNKNNLRPLTPIQGDDNSSIILDLRNRIEKLETSHEKAAETLDNHDGRIEALEQDNDTNKDKISSNKQDIGELKDQISEKVDCDLFDQEITYIKELLNQLLEGKDIDVKIPPPSNSGMSTKDQNKMKDMLARIPELEKMLQDVLERLKRAESNIDGHSNNLKDHDSEIEKIWEELAKKADQSDLKDIFDRLISLERDLAKVIEALNDMGKNNAPVISGIPNNNDKRLDALEKKIEEVRNDINNGLRDLNKQIDSLNDRAGRSEEEIEKLKNDLLKLMKKVNDLELKIDTILKTSGNNNNNNVTMSGIDPEKLDELKKALNDLRNDYRNFKNEIYDKFNQVDNELNLKADKEDLEKLKKMLLDKLNELENALNKTKSDLKRALKILNDKVPTPSITIIIDC